MKYSKMLKKFINRLFDVVIRLSSQILKSFSSDIERI